MKSFLNNKKFLQIAILMSLTIFAACGTTNPRMSQLLMKPEKMASSIKILYIKNSISDPKIPNCNERFDDPAICAGAARDHLYSVRFFEVGEKIVSTAPALLVKRKIASTVNVIALKELKEIVNELKSNKSDNQYSYLVLFFSGGQSSRNSRFGTTVSLRLTAQYRDAMTNKTYWQGIYDVEAKGSLLPIDSKTEFNEEFVSNMISTVFTDMEQKELLPIAVNN